MRRLYITLCRCIIMRAEGAPHSNWSMHRHAYIIEDITIINWLVFAIKSKILSPYESWPQVKRLDTVLWWFFGNDICLFFLGCWILLNTIGCCWFDMFLLYLHCIYLAVLRRDYSTDTTTNIEIIYMRRANVCISMRCCRN